MSLHVINAKCARCGRPVTSDTAEFYLDASQAPSLALHVVCKSARFCQEDDDA